jgi:hypothetical protein
MVKLSLIQLRSSTDITANLAIIAKYLAQITTELPRIENPQDTDSKVVVTHLVVLP